MRGFQRGFRKQDSVVGDDANRHAFDAGEAGDDRGAVGLLELVQFRTIDEARDHFAHVILGGERGRHDAIEFACIVKRRTRIGNRDVRLFAII